jgi:tetratricopeptide (TPR) repeat protein
LTALEDRHEAAKEHARLLAARPAEPYNLFPLRAAVELAHLIRAGDLLATARRKLRAIEAHYPSTRTSAYALFAEALSSSAAGRNGEAITLMNQSEALWPDLTAAFARAVMHFGAGQFAEALPLYEHVIEKRTTAMFRGWQTHWIQSLAFAGRCLNAMGRVPEAAEKYAMFLRRWGARSELPLVQDIVLRSRSLGR